MTENRSIVVALSGDLDLSMREQVKTALPQAGAVDRLVIDCSAVTSLESVVIAVFMHYRRNWIAAGHDPHNIIFIVPSPLRRIFDITGMSKWFTIIGSETADTGK